jgi:hypothetical protein
MNRNVALIRRFALVVIALLAALSLAFQSNTAAASSALSLVGTWHRLNPGSGGPSPEHEVLRCGGTVSISCIYDKQPEPLLGFTNPPDSTMGFFRGTDATASWSCPAWFPAAVCAGTQFVASGVMTYHQSSGSLLVANHDLVVSNVGGQAQLYVYWPDNGFACPWFRSFSAALAANPFPLPFDGVDYPAQDCVAAP